MQNLDVISVNLWQILISLANLLIMFLIIKKFLYKPVKATLAKRQEELDAHYQAAETAEQDALRQKADWEAKMADAKAQADRIVDQATEQAKFRSDAMLEEAHQKAEALVQMAQTQAQLERRKAQEGIKREIVEVSGMLTEKMLEREINTEDHRKLIDSFIDQIGESDE